MAYLGLPSILGEAMSLTSMAQYPGVWEAGVGLCTCMGLLPLHAVHHAPAPSWVLLSVTVTIAVALPRRSRGPAEDSRRERDAPSDPRLFTATSAN